MFREYAIYKANRDMLNKRYSLRTEEQRMRDIEFKYHMNEHKQQLEIEMKKDKKKKVKKAKKKAEEAAMVKYQDIIEKLRKDIDNKQSELDIKDEENKLMSVKIESLEVYKSNHNSISPEQVYNSINNCQVKFDKDFRLDLYNLEMI